MLTCSLCISGLPIKHMMFMGFCNQNQWPPLQGVVLTYHYSRFVFLVNQIRNNIYTTALNKAYCEWENMI
jgi:hypothetical protein